MVESIFHNDTVSLWASVGSCLSMMISIPPVIALKPGLVIKYLVIEWIINRYLGGNQITGTSLI